MDSTESTATKTPSQAAEQAAVVDKLKDAVRKREQEARAAASATAETMHKHKAAWAEAEAAAKDAKAAKAAKAAEAGMIDEQPYYCDEAEMLRAEARKKEKDAEEAAQTRDRHLEIAKAAKYDMTYPSRSYAAACVRWREATKNANDSDRLRESHLFAAANTYLEASAFEGQTLARAAQAAAAAANKTTA